MSINLLYFLTAAASTLFLLSILQPIAVKISLVDRPKDHKHHQGNVPVVGGLAMFAGFWATVLLLDAPCPNKLSFGIASSLLVTVGAWDDYCPLSVWIRLIVQCVAALLIIMGGGVIIENIGDILGFGEIVLGRWLAIPLTVIVIVGIINAMNMIDGLDGLAGSLDILLFFCLLVLTTSTSLANDGYFILLIFLATVSSFLVFNFPLFTGRQAKIFMGDAGSTFLGLTVGWFLVLFSQKPHNVISPIMALWLFAIPLLDILTLILRRVALGSSPFKANTDHLHHILLLMGYSPPQALGIIIIFASLFSLVVLLDKYIHFSHALLFYVFIGLFVGYCYVTSHKWLEFSHNNRRSLHELIHSS